MTMKIHHQLIPVYLLLQLIGCTRPQTCPECDGEDIPVEDEDEGPDLPCGGADLQTDDLNCGACGNACDVMWAGTKYAAGGCVNGECGRTWTGLNPLSPPPAMETCEQWCAFGDFECVPRGCSGMTAFVCEIVGDFGNQCNLGDPLHQAIVEMTGECDEVIPYPNNVESGNYIYYACCCGP